MYWWEVSIHAFGIKPRHIDDITLEILQSCTKPSIYDEQVFAQQNELYIVYCNKVQTMIDTIIKETNEMPYILYTYIMWQAGTVSYFHMVWGYTQVVSGENGTIPSSHIHAKDIQNIQTPSPLPPHPRTHTSCYMNIILSRLVYWGHIQYQTRSIFKIQSLLCYFSQ